MQPASNPQLRPPSRAPQPRPYLVEAPPPRRGWLWAAFLLGLALGGLWLTTRPADKKAAWAPRRTGTARMATMERTLRVTGVTQAQDFSYLVAPRLRGTRHNHGAGDFSLTLDKLNPSGSKVKKGDIVASFDRQFMMLRLEDYRSDVDQQERNLHRLRANLNVVRAAIEQRVRRYKGLLDKAELDLKTAPVRSAITTAKFAMNLEEAKARYREVLLEMPQLEISELAAIRRYEIEVIQAQRELQKATKNVDDMVFRAPMDGTLVVKKTRRGTSYSEMSEGDAVGSGYPFAEIVDSSKLIVVGSLNQADGELVRLGMEARVHFDAFTDVQVSARVSSIGALSTSGSRPAYVRHVPLRLTLGQTSEQVIPNLSAYADIVLEREPNALVVPRECVFTDGEQAFAMVENGDGWERRDIELGLGNSTEVSVVSGLKQGARLAMETPNDHR